MSTPPLVHAKAHYPILDGLRGVAALMVVCFHIFEAFASSPISQKINHGYLAVDFFYVLSGFVIGYAYDDRWDKMRTIDFFKRRIIRLQPMLVVGVLVGAISFAVQGCETWDGVRVSVLPLFVAILFSVFLIPMPANMGADVRGYGEMFPLNGPSWSLFFEYIANFLYALFLRRFSTKMLAFFALCAGAGLVYFVFANGSDYYSLNVGWTLAGDGFLGGALRVAFSFSAGLFLSRIFKPYRIKNSFGICALAIVLLLLMPYVGTANTMWLNGIYDILCIIVVFPLVLYFGASGHIKNKKLAKCCSFLGDISYPLYITHYPLMYLFYAWVWGRGMFARTQEHIHFSQSWHIALLLFVGSFLLAYLYLKRCDEPARKFLTKYFNKEKRTKV